MIMSSAFRQQQSCFCTFRLQARHGSKRMAVIELGRRRILDRSLGVKACLQAHVAMACFLLDVFVSGLTIIIKGAWTLLTCRSMTC